MINLCHVTYDPDRNIHLVRPKASSWKIGTSLRPNLNTGERNVPGAGNYSKAQDLGHNPKYTMVGKGNTGDFQNGVPGPGLYTGTNAIYEKIHLGKLE